MWESRAPRTSRELAVRNQFFTPLRGGVSVDNTRGGSGSTGRGVTVCVTVLSAGKPDEQQSLLSAYAIRGRSSYSIRRAGRCISALCLDLFLDIYREAWAWEQTYGPGSLDAETGGSAGLKPLSQTYANQDAFFTTCRG